MGDSALGLLPQLRSGTGEVGLRIVAVGKLIEHLAAPFRGHLDRQIASAFHALFLAHQNQLCAVGGHGGLAFGARVVRHDQDEFVALDRRGHGQGDAGIAGSGFDQGVAGLDIAARFGPGNHRQRGTVLDRAGGVVAFELDQDGVTGFTGQTLQANQRGVADAIGDGRVLNCHGFDGPHSL